jgi:hypothetical protein
MLTVFSLQAHPGCSDSRHGRYTLVLELYPLLFTNAIPFMLPRRSVTGQ